MYCYDIKSARGTIAWTLNASVCSIRCLEGGLSTATLGNSVALAGGSVNSVAACAGEARAWIVLVTLYAVGGTFNARRYPVAARLISL